MWNLHDQGSNPCPSLGRQILLPFKVAQDLTRQWEFPSIWRCRRSESWKHLLLFSLKIILVISRGVTLENIQEGRASVSFNDHGKLKYEKGLNFNKKELEIYPFTTSKLIFISPMRLWVQVRFVQVKDSSLLVRSMESLLSWKEATRSTGASRKKPDGVTELAKPHINTILQSCTFSSIMLHTPLDLHSFLPFYPLNCSNNLFIIAEM